jgi:hypothetical protein
MHTNWTSLNRSAVLQRHFVICQVSEIYSKRWDIIISAKVEVGSLVLVDFCKIFGSSWFQSFNVVGIKLSWKISVRVCGIWNWWLCPFRCFLLLWLMSEMGMFAYPLSPLCSRMNLFSCLIRSLSMNDLRWNKHIYEVTNKANKLLGMLRRNLYFCTKDVRETAYLSLVSR